MISFSVLEIERLKEKFGEPFYVFDEKAFIENYTDFKNAMQSLYPNYRVSYSYKTNYTPYICSLVKKLGGYAEVVSDMEYHVAKKVGYTDNKIIYNGPDKGESGIYAVTKGCIVNVDGIDELKAIIKFADKNPKTQIKVGLRVNLDVGQDFISRFGMDEKDIDKAFDMAGRTQNVKIVGLHCHISRCRGVDAWRKRTETMLALADKYFSEELPEYIDLGSGMFGKMDDDFKKQFDYVPSYSEYATVTAGIFAEHYKNIEQEKKPILFTEPGTTLINKYIDFVCKVDGIKSVRGKTFAILNCSEHNLGETCALKRLPINILPTNAEREKYENADFVGYTCLEQDVMYKDYTGEIAVNDYVQFGNVGGYSNVYKPPFIRPNCAMLVKKCDGSYSVIKRKETYTDLLHTYAF